MSINPKVIVVLFAFTGCAGEDIGDPPTVDGARQITEDVPVSGFAQPEVPEDVSPEGCELAIDITGACSLACFPDAVIEHHVPAGTCATFACELSDGSTLHVGGCNL
jgi:hypothetical protein